MSRSLGSPWTIKCDLLGCRRLFDESSVCSLTETRTSAKTAGWAVNVPRGRGPRNINPVARARRGDYPRLDFCPEHRGVLFMPDSAISAKPCSLLEQTGEPA